MKRPNFNKTPTHTEYLAYDGRSCRSLWKKTKEDWKCPGCGRSKFQILRWHKKKGWIGGLARHHDHYMEHDNSGKWARFVDEKHKRFPETVICTECNNADGQAKRLLKLDGSFSFKPSELRQFVIPSNHGLHRLNLEKASELNTSTILNTHK